MQPAFILFAPQLGENIGAVARAMSNFGLSDLRIVAPRDGWPNPAANAMAAHGEHLIENALVVNTLKEAMQDITTLYATTPRGDVLNKKVLTPKEAMQNIALTPSPSGVGVKTAILFGPERAGLSNEDIVLADAIISIPVNPENPSLNIAQAAVVIAYEWFLASNENSDAWSESVDERAISQRSDASCESQQTFTEANNKASKAELEGLFEHAKELMDEVNYFREPHKTKLMWQHLRSIWVKSNLTQQEVKTLRGMIRALKRKMTRCLDD